MVCSSCGMHAAAVDEAVVADMLLQLIWRLPAQQWLGVDDAECFLVLAVGCCTAVGLRCCTADAC